MHIKVGNGGRQNFLKQHNPGYSKACQTNLKKKNKTGAHQQSQPGLLSFFTKKSMVLIPPSIPTPAPVIAYAMESGSPFSGTHMMEITPTAGSPVPNMHAVNILATLEKAIENLPDLPFFFESALFMEGL